MVPVKTLIKDFYPRSFKDIYNRVLSILYSYIICTYFIFKKNIDSQVHWGCGEMQFFRGKMENQV